MPPCVMLWVKAEAQRIDASQMNKLSPRKLGAGVGDRTHSGCSLEHTHRSDGRLGMPLPNARKKTSRNYEENENSQFLLKIFVDA